MKFTMTKFCLNICLAVLLASCSMTSTSTKIKDPVFSDENKFEKEVLSLVMAENINLKGKEIITKKKTTSELEVSITNGQNIPTGHDERKALGKSIAITIKRNLKDPNEFDTYQVLFVTKVENSSVIKRNWVGNVFSSKEL